MTKTLKELAYLRDLYVENDWTRRFTELADKHVATSGVQKALYMNAGVGNHCFEIREKLGKDAAIFGRCEDEFLMAIARDKSAAMKSDVDFSMTEFDDDVFDLVIVDLSLVPSAAIAAFVQDAIRATEIGGRTAVLFPSSGSFGEMISLLWEVLVSEDLGDHGHEAERLVASIPTVAYLEELCQNAGLKDVKSFSEREVFEYKNGDAVIESPLVSDFLLPSWLDSLSEAEMTRVKKSLSKLIDAEDGDLTFRFSVKAALVVGEKADKI